MSQNHVLPSGAKAGELCGQVHVELGMDGPVEVPCQNVAQYELAGDTDWHVCDECLRALQQEGIEEALSPVRLGAVDLIGSP